MNAFDRMVLVAAVAVACSGGGGTAPCGSGGTAASVSVCDNFFGPVGGGRRYGTVQFPSPLLRDAGPNSSVINYQTFTLAVGLPAHLGVGMRYATKRTKANETEVYARRSSAPSCARLPTSVRCIERSHRRSTFARRSR
jgi:hypothetical protein